MNASRARLKERLKNGETVVGPFVIVPSMTMVDSLGYSGMDFCIIDTEHGPINMQTAADLVIAADGVGVSPVIRVGANDDRLILRALDIGSSGVQVPQINTKSDAEAVVSASKYAPLGERGLSVFTRAGDYFKYSGDGHTERQNEDTTVIIHIEGRRGLANLEEIMTVPGIDVFFLGPYDISQSLGIPGQVTDDRVAEALRNASEQARSQGRVVGSYAKDTNMGRWLLEIGVQYLAINVDVTIYTQACEQIGNELRR